MKIALISFSDRGYALGVKLAEELAQHGEATCHRRCPEGGLEQWTASEFSTSEALIFIGSCGIAVRAIAPFVKHKGADPAVLVVDESGRFAISLLSGHLGGANALTRKVASLISAEPVITTATDIQGLWAVDTWARESNCRIKNMHRIKTISANLLKGQEIRLSSLWPISGTLPRGLELDLVPESACPQEGVFLTWKAYPPEDSSVLWLVPQVLTLGIGCRKDAGLEAITTLYDEVMQLSGADPEAIARVCSIDLKADEPALLEFCRLRQYEFHCYSAAELNALEGSYSASEFVSRITGVDNVCERSAVLGSGGGQLLVRKQARDGVTMALALAPARFSFDPQALHGKIKE